MDKEKIFDLYGHNLGTIRQNEQWISRAQKMEVIEKKSAPGVTRTRGTRIRNPLLYPPELQGHGFNFKQLQRPLFSRFLSVVKFVTVQN